MLSFPCVDYDMVSVTAGATTRHDIEAMGFEELYHALCACETHVLEHHPEAPPEAQFFTAERNLSVSCMKKLLALLLKIEWVEDAAPEEIAADAAAEVLFCDDNNNQAAPAPTMTRSKRRTPPPLPGDDDECVAPPPIKKVKTDGGEEGGDEGGEANKTEGGGEEDKEGGDN